MSNATTNADGSSTSFPVLIGMGNPLLDISAEVDEAFLKKYGLEPNNAILADESHMPLYEEMIAKYPVRYIAGGAAQSTIRGAQWLLPRGSTAFFGCVGEDRYATTLRDVTRTEGVSVAYMTTRDVSTGTCAVLITHQGTQRSLVAHLAAAQHYHVSHLQSQWSLVSNARFFYVEGYFLTVALDAIEVLANEAVLQNKVFAFNLSAPFVCQLPSLDKVLPFCDYLFGNDVEAKVVAESQGWIPVNSSSLSSSSSSALSVVSVMDVVAKLAQVPKANQHRPRVVVITQGQDDVVVGTWDPRTREVAVKEYPIHPIGADQIVDTNGAGDAFVGGFLSQLVQGKSLETCLKAAVWTAHKIIQVHGAEYPKHVAIPEDFEVLQIPEI